MSNKENLNIDSAEKWDIEIKPKARLFGFSFGEVWQYGDLLILFVRRDFIAAYKQTILGPLWHLIQPVLTSLMFLIVFTRIARLPTDGIHPIVFYLSGITLWNFFSISLTSTSNTFVSNASIFGKVYFPRIITPLSIIISNSIRFGIQFILLLIVMIWFSFHGYPIHFSLYWFLIPFLLVWLGAMALGLGIIVSSLTTKYRDFAVLLTFAVQLLMYATPITYPLSYIQQQGLGWIIKLNPMTSVVEIYRYALFGKGTFMVSDIFYSIAFMFVVLFLGVILFNKVEKTFIDTV